MSLCRFSYAAFGDSNIIAVAVDTALYVAKKNSPVVEVWDKKTEKLCELIDCVHFLKYRPGSLFPVERAAVFTVHRARVGWGGTVCLSFDFSFCLSHKDRSKIVSVCLPQLEITRKFHLVRASEQGPSR